jgi:lipopolysaccharide export system ATP-binding protein
MSPDERPPVLSELDILFQLEGCDVASLLALQVVLHRTPAEPTAFADLTAGLLSGYARLPGGEERDRTPLGLPWRPGTQSPEDAEHHVRTGPIAALAERMLVESDESSVWLSPSVAAMRPVVRRQVDERLDQLETILAGPEQVPAELPPPVPPPAIVTTRAAADGEAPGRTLSAAGLVKVYRKRQVVNNVAVKVSQGEIVGLLGPNGAGKTTTFYMMVGLIAPDAGRVLIGREDLTKVPMYRRARKGIGYLAQEPSIFRKLTVEENILAILQMLRLSRKERRRRLEELLDELGIKHLRRSKAYALSGGERRRLEITRALVAQPKFMLLDEPFAGVDPIAVHDIQQIVADLRRRDIGVLISDHNVEQTLDIVDRAYIMYDGRVRVSGTVSELVWNDEVAEIYLGPTLTARMRQRYTYPEAGRNP